jgi:hypothetical protein
MSRISIRSMPAIRRLFFGGAGGGSQISLATTTSVGAVGWPLSGLWGGGGTGCAGSVM